VFVSPSAITQIAPKTAILALLVLTACQSGLTSIGYVEDGTDFNPEVPDGTDVDGDSDTLVVNNTSPVADAGLDQTGQSGAVIDLDGSSSFDPDGDELAYEWVFSGLPSGSAATLLNDFREDPQFYADVAGIYEVELTVDDGALFDSDTLTVTVTDSNGVPMANAGPDQTVSATSSVQLNGGNSTDPDDDALNYTWQFSSRPSGSSAVLSSSFSPTPRFTADLAGSYVLSLVVDDGMLSSSADAVTVTATGSGGGSGGGDCGDCGTYVESELRQRRQTGRAASALGLFTLPFIVLFWQRRRK
jgi:hypothetical protein